MFRLAKFLLAVAAIASATALSAQESTLPDMSTDRPSVGAGPDIVPAASLQFETGASVLFNANAYTADLPETLMRLGIGHRSELRFTVSNGLFDPDHAPGSKSLQFQDINSGVKVNLAEANHGPVQAVLLGLGIPTGGEDQTSGSFDPSFILIAQQNLPKHWSLTENLGAVMTSVDSKRHTNWLPGLVVARQIDKSLGWFAEYAPTVSVGAGPVHILDAGFTWLRTATTQLDFRAGRQKDDLGGRNIVSLGFSRRLDGFAPGLSRRIRKADTE